MRLRQRGKPVMDSVSRTYAAGFKPQPAKQNIGFHHMLESGGYTAGFVGYFTGLAIFKQGVVAEVRKRQPSHGGMSPRHIHGE